jgi:DnaJ family protein C protein 13
MMIAGPGGGGGAGGGGDPTTFDPTRSSSASSSEHGASASGHSLEHIKEWRYRDPKPPGGEVGPISVKELGRLLDAEQIATDTLCWADGMEDWAPISRVRQLRWRLLTSGDSLLSAGAAAGLALKILRRLLTLHAAVTPNGKLVRPIPRAKRFLSSRRCLPHIVQSILSGHPEVIESATLLLLDLVDNNDVLNSKLYSRSVLHFFCLH